ncbi:MAG: restriction endonuclease, partial [Desulfobacterales bacterium]|nr:restriction endonuclease [Desulfobacterales bacterium]
MKLADHVEVIRKLIDNSFRNRLGRIGINSNHLQPLNLIPEEHHEDRKRIESILEILTEETGNLSNAYEKLIEEFTFTLFNRLAALKVMEAHSLNPEIVTRRSQHGDRSFAHRHWLEQNPDRRSEEMEGLTHFIEYQLTELSSDIPLFSPSHSYHLLPTAIELNAVINAFNQVEIDEQLESDIWKSDDVLGWLYESYNNTKKTLHKESKAKTEYDKVSIQSQVYTPRWVVK